MKNLLEKIQKKMKGLLYVLGTLSIVSGLWFCQGDTVLAAETIPTVSSTSGTATYINGNYTYYFSYSIGNTAKYAANDLNICHVTKIECAGASTSINLNVNTKVKYNDKAYNLKIVSVGNGSQCVVVNNSSKALASISLSSSITEIKPFAFNGSSCSKFTSVTIPKICTKIGTSAFEGCDSLKTVKFASGSLCESIGDYAFYNCTALANVADNATNYTLPASVKTIGKYAFSGTALSQFNTNTGVTSIGESAFYDCTSLNTLTIGTGVTSIGENAFLNAPLATKITYNATSKSVSLNDVFVDKQTATVSIGSGVKSIPNNFIKGNTAVNSITIPANCTSIGSNAFYGCTALKTLTFNTISKCTTIGESAFYGCNSLATVALPDSLTAIGASAFYDCTALNTLTVGKNVTSIGHNAFYNAPLATSITYNAVNLTTDAFQNKKTVAVTIGTGVTQLPDGVFKNCTSLTKVTFVSDSSCISIGEYAFYNCSALATVIGDGKNGSLPAYLKTIGDYAFYGTAITSLNTNAGVEAIGNYAFANCSALKTVTIGSSVEKIGENAFSGDTSLTTLTLGVAVTKIGENAFENAPLTTITYNAANLKTHNNVFNNKGTTTITIATTVTQLPDYIFQYNTSLKSVTFAKTSKCTRIGSYAFYNCSALATVIGDGKNGKIPDSVTSIGSYAFAGTALTSLIIKNASYSDTVFYKTSSDAREKKEYSYKNSAQPFTAKYTGQYLLEVWGAQGGGSYAGGGYTYGYVNLEAGDTLYIYTGGKGSYSNSGTSSATYNGGGSSLKGAGSGGGATHIATTNRGVLSTYEGYQDEVLVVAGGSGGKGSEMDPNSPEEKTYISNGIVYSNLRSHANSSTVKTLGGGGGTNIDDWTLSKRESGKLPDYIFSTNTGEGVFGKGQNATKATFTNSFQGNPGAGGGGWTGGTINRGGYGSDKTYDITYSTGLLGGSGGTGYINTNYVYEGATEKPTDSDRGNLENGKAAVTYMGRVEATITINSKYGCTVNDKHYDSGLISITGNAGETIKFPTLVGDNNYKLVGYKIISDPDGILETDDTYNGKPYIKYGNLPDCITMGFNSIELEAVYKAQMSLSITKKSDTDYTMTINQPDDLAKFYKVLYSIDNGKTWSIIPNSKTSSNDATKYEQSFTYTGTYQSYTAPVSGYYYIEATGASSVNHGTWDKTNKCLNIEDNLSLVKGGFSSGYRFLHAGQTIYVSVGGYGYCTNLKTGARNHGNGKGGWNGGTSGHDHDDRCNSGGGGCTSWMTTLRGTGKNIGLLSQYSNNKEDVILVAGGAGGILRALSPSNIDNGAGGGLIGDDSQNGAVGGQQNGKPNFFGKGGNLTTKTDDDDYGGAGGGWYGGSTQTTDDGGGGGGSGYIGGVYDGVTIQGGAKESSVEVSFAGTAYIRLNNIIYTDTSFSDLHLIDVAKPNQPSDGSYSYSNNNLILSWKNNGDNGTTSLYKAESYALLDGMENEQDALNEDSLLETSETLSYTYTSEVKGYYYYIDTKSTGTVTNANNYTTSTSITTSIPTTVSYLHVAAIDNAGNIGPTLNYEIQGAYNIAYELNGGKHGSSHPNSAYTESTFTVSNPSRDGFEFQGWTITGMDNNTHYYGSKTTTANTLSYKDVGPNVTTFKNLNTTRSDTVLFTAVWKDVSAPEVKISYLNISDEANADRDGIIQDGLVSSIEAGKAYTPNIWTPHTVKVTAVGTDKGTGIDTMKWKDGEWTSAQSLERTYQVGGEYDGTVHAKDKANVGNDEKGKAWIANDKVNEIVVPYGTIKIDKKAPTALIKKEGYNEDGYTSGKVTIKVTNIKDNVGGSGLPDKLYSWDHGSTWTSVSYKEYTKNKNDYVLIRDNVGNYRKLEYEASNIDPNPPGVDPDPDNPPPTPPTPPVPSEPWVKIGKVEYSWINHDVKLTFTIKDTTPEEAKDDFTTSGVKSVRIYRSDKNFEEEGTDIASESNSVPGVESTKISFTCKVQGITYWVLEAKDYAGNVTKIQITVRVDKTNPTVTCDPQQFDLNAYGIDEVEDVIKDDDEVYCTFNIFGKDYNDASRGEYVASGDSSGIKQVVLRIMDADDASSYKDYDLGYKVSTAKECDNTDKGLLEAEFGLKINTFADFPEAVYLKYEIKIVDNADNEAYYACMDGNEIPNFSVKAVMFSNEDIEFNDKTTVTATDERTGITKDIETNVPYMQLGDFGYVNVWTIGYVQSIRMDYSPTSFAEDVGDEMVAEIKAKKIPSKYNLGILSDINYQRDVSISKADKIVTAHSDVDGVPYAAKYGIKESDPDTNGYKWQAEGTSVRIPLYYELMSDGTKKKDGQDNYIPEIHNGVVYGIKKKNPTSPVRLTTPSDFMYIIYDTKADDVHYRITHEG